MASVALRGISKSYGNGLSTVSEVDLDIAQGEFCVLLGASGCGKSTLLRLIAGLEDITEGDLFIGDRRMNDVPPARRGVAMVFQSYALFPHMTVYENLSFGLSLTKTDKRLIRETVMSAARALQIDHLLERKPRALSGGQRQRVAIGRAIVRQPGVFLFDEPLSNLDAALRAQTRYEIARIHKGVGDASTVYVTHDQVEAMTLADRVVLLHSGEAAHRHGSIAQCGSPLDLYHRPRNRFVAEFIGSPKMNFIPAVLVEANEAAARFRLANGALIAADVDARRLQVGETVALGIRPEDATVHTQLQHIVCEVKWQERLGDATYVYLRSGEENVPWVVKLPGTASVVPGQRLPFALPRHALHVFDEQGDALERRIEHEPKLQWDVPSSSAAAQRAVHVS